MKGAVLLFVLSMTFLTSGAQRTDSVCHEKEIQRFKLKKMVVPAVLIGGGTFINGNKQEGIKMEVAEERNEWIPRFQTHIDDYLQFSPIAIAYGLEAFGVRSKTDRLNRTVILLKGELLMLSVTQLTKHFSHQKRPDGSNDASFPSGHTAQAFAAATLLNEEYKDKYSWMPFLSYGLASSVGCLRIANNKHYLSDVVVGAGVGILSMKLAYWTHGYKWGRQKTTKKVSLN